MLCLTSCSVIHQSEIGDQDFTIKNDAVTFEVMVNEVGFSVEEAGALADAVLRNQHDSEMVRNIKAIISLFQMGPRTGNPVFTDKYADALASKVYEECPNGTIHNLQILRETNKYPVISGEIIRVTGYCLHSK